MKTLHLSIIAGLCISIALSLFLVVIETTRPSNVFHSSPAGQTTAYPSNLTEQLTKACTAGPGMSCDNQPVTMSQNNETNTLTEYRCGQFFTVPQDNHIFGSETYPVLILKENSVDVPRSLIQ